MWFELRSSQGKGRLRESQTPSPGNALDTTPSRAHVVRQLALQCAYSLRQCPQALPPGTEERKDRLWLEFLKVGVGERKTNPRAGIPRGNCTPGEWKDREEGKVLAQPLPS